MSAGPDLSSLSHAQKDALIAALRAQVASLTARVAELEAKLGLPPKTPDNSSVPPPKGQKPSESSAPKGKAKPHAGAHRPLHPNPTSRREVLARRSLERFGGGPARDRAPRDVEISVVKMYLSRGLSCNAGQIELVTLLT